MVRWIIFAAIEVGMAFWLVAGIRMKMRHEVSVSAGFVLFTALCFQQWGHLFPIKVPILAEHLALRIASGVLMAGAGVLAATTFWTLRYRGKPTDGWENTTVLIDTGVFGLIRHPIYMAAFLVALGAMLHRISMDTLVLGIAALVCFTLAAWFEDSWNEGKFGEVYFNYRKKTKRFVPFIW